MEEEIHFLLAQATEQKCSQALRKVLGVKPSSQASLCTTCPVGCHLAERGTGSLSQPVSVYTLLSKVSGWKVFKRNSKFSSLFFILPIPFLPFPFSHMGLCPGHQNSLNILSLPPFLSHSLDHSPSFSPLIPQTRFLSLCTTESHPKGKTNPKRRRDQRPNMHIQFSSFSFSFSSKNCPQQDLSLKHFYFLIKIVTGLTQVTKESVEGF